MGENHYFEEKWIFFCFVFAYFQKKKKKGIFSFKTKKKQNLFKFFLLKSKKKKKLLFHQIHALYLPNIERQKHIFPCITFKLKSKMDIPFST